MMKPSPLAAALMLAVACLATPSAHAGPGHDHGDAPAVATGDALPRFAAVSESFELVGVLEGRRIALYLDRAADNSPVSEARIELDIGETKLVAEKRGDDAFEATLAAEPAPGMLPVTATVTVGDEVDLLVGELDIHAADHDDADAHAHAWSAYVGWGAAALAALLALAYAGRRIVASRRLPTGDAA